MSTQAVPATRTVQLRTILSVLVVGALLPAIVLLSFAIWRAGVVDRETSSAQFQAQATSMAQMFHSALQANVTVVRALASLPAVEGAPLGRAADAATIFNARVAADIPENLFGPIPEGHGSWAVSNLVDSGADGQVEIAMHIDLPGEAAPLVLLMDPRELTAALNFDMLSYTNMLVAVVDGEGRVIARSRDQDRFVGARVPTWDALVALGTDHGIFDAELLDGDSITFSFATIEHTPGWVVVAGMPTAVFNSRWAQPVAFVALGSAIAATIALLCALLVASRIAAPVAGLANYAHESLVAPAPEPVSSRITEYETLRRALIEAHAELAQRAESLALSEGRYRAMAKAGSMVTWRRAATGELIDIDGWEEATGRSSDEMLGTAFARRIHPDDYQLVEKAWQSAVATGGTFDVEARVSPDGEIWRWLRARGVAIRDADGTPIEWVGTLEDITPSKERQLQEAYLATHDELTGLPNRAVLRERLENATSVAATGIISALLYVDLDHFKQANDTHGHAAGDALLRMASERMSALMRMTDTAARLGGDEFAVLLQDIGHVDTALSVGLRLVRTLSTPFDIGGVTIRVGASVGIALIDADGHPSDIIKQADMALYEAKGAGRNRCMVYDPTRYDRLTA
jgi:diguanylate cyclase (GGDEF)-like protein/PAS domain S-box-containing protein